MTDKKTIAVVGATFRWMGIAAVAASSVACQPQAGSNADGGVHLTGGTAVERGRYLAIAGGCNDCHTNGYLLTEGNVPETEWLLGSPVGWRGPWGTTYPPNLRLTVQDLTEDEWVTLLRTRKALPPMPWVNANQLAEADAGALYAYIRSLGPAGERMPTALPPEQEPTTPYLSLFPVMPGG